MIADEIAVVDTDSHLTELPDLWLSRLPSKWAEVAPRVEYFPEQGEDYWFIGGRPTHGAWTHSQAGWSIPPPSHPRVFSEVDPSTYDPLARARALDEFGIATQVLYPNIVAFQLQAILGVNDRDFSLACVSAYNDYVVEFARAAPNRFVPIMALPFWDLDASLAELSRCAELGHKGIVFANRPEVLGAPLLADPDWDPLWARAQDAGLSINFHVGFGAGFDTKPLMKDGASSVARTPAAGLSSPAVEELPAGRMSKQMLDLGEEGMRNYRLDLLRVANRAQNSNSMAILEVITSGICHRFPSLNFVSVESGWGYVPFVVLGADHSWVVCGAAASLPDRLLPSEYFRRQCYATFWWESETVTRTVDLFPDNVMFETDFPHVVALMPGAGGTGKSAKETIESNLSGLPKELLEKILSSNARRVYHLDGL